MDLIDFFTDMTKKKKMDLRYNNKQSTFIP